MLIGCQEFFSDAAVILILSKALTHFWGRNECVTNEPQRTFAGRLGRLNVFMSFELGGAALGGTPYNGLYEEAPPERSTFIRPQVYERAGILLVEV